MHQLQIDGNFRHRKFLAEGFALAARITGDVGGLLDVRQGDDFRVRVRLEDVLEALNSRVDGATERGRGHQFDVVVVREVLAKLAALLVAEIGEERVGDDVVGRGEVMHTLIEGIVSSRPNNVEDSVQVEDRQRDLFMTIAGECSDVPGRGERSG